MASGMGQGLSDHLEKTSNDIVTYGKGRGTVSCPPVAIH